MTLSGQVNKSIITYSSITKEQLKNPKYYNILHHYQNRTQKIRHPYLQEHSKGGNATQKGTAGAASPLKKSIGYVGVPLVGAASPLWLQVLDGKKQNVRVVAGRSSRRDEVGNSGGARFLEGN